MARARQILLGSIMPALLIVVWHVLSERQVFSATILPSPLAVLHRWISYLAPQDALAPGFDWLAWLDSSEMLSDAYSTLYRVLAGFAIGAGLALPLGLLMGADKRVYVLFDPLVQFLRPIPPIAFIPLSILWFGLGNPPALFLIAIGSFFPVLLNTIAGVHHVDSLYIRAAQNLGAGPFTLFRRVILPAAMPNILTGARVGLGTAFIVVIVAEMIAVNSGLGYRILEAREYQWPDKVIAGMITIGMLGLGLDLMMVRLNAYLLRWHRGLEHR